MRYLRLNIRIGACGGFVEWQGIFVVGGTVEDGEVLVGFHSDKNYHQLIHLHGTLSECQFTSKIAQSFLLVWQY